MSRDKCKTFTITDPATGKTSTFEDFTFSLTPKPPAYDPDKLRDVEWLIPNEQPDILSLLSFIDRRLILTTEAGENLGMLAWARTPINDPWENVPKIGVTLQGFPFLRKYVNVETPEYVRTIRLLFASEEQLPASLVLESALSLDQFNEKISLACLEETLFLLLGLINRVANLHASGKSAFNYDKIIASGTKVLPRANTRLLSELINKMKSTGQLEIISRIKLGQLLINWEFLSSELVKQDKTVKAVYDFFKIGYGSHGFMALSLFHEMIELLGMSEDEFFSVVKAKFVCDFKSDLDRMRPHLLARPCWYRNAHHIFYELKYDFSANNHCFMAYLAYTVCGLIKENRIPNYSRVQAWSKKVLHHEVTVIQQVARDLVEMNKSKINRSQARY